MQEGLHRPTPELMKALEELVPNMTYSDMQECIDNPNRTRKRLLGLKRPTSLTEMDNVQLSWEARKLLSGEIGTLQQTKGDFIGEHFHDDYIIRQVCKNKIFTSTADLDTTICYLLSNTDHLCSKPHTNNIFYVHHEDDTYWFNVFYNPMFSTWEAHTEIISSDNIWNPSSKLFVIVEPQPES